MTILLIEDEPLIARQLQKLVRVLEPGATIDGPLASVQSICAYFNTIRSTARLTPDLVIADIQLADGVSFEAFQQVGLDVPVIFITAFDEYAIRAFKLNSIDYLLKPIDPNDLKTALVKYHRWVANGMTGFSEQFQQFLSQILERPTTPQYKRRFTGHYLRQIMSVTQEETAYFLRNELIYLYTNDGRKLITDYKTLDELEELLDPACFFRANRQCLVHLNAVAGYRPLDNSKLQIALKPPHEALELLVSKEKAAAFRHWIEG
ncbi:LytR/AlgR family response regulator transcription factor [Spirosoma radiotolerans]|uniref:LytTR family transcriptional regulator n=1 Tax=Spirosoma radiotolerans TaxID=1379870 RepID=A0A0E3ZWK4_9BACT|nr:LytTR family DNA-binding domain-containing protein [Spirosoma radiotolerans]AKD55800.1 LytTR family transcriptional regulator [Spirosoma radiotolerans]